MNVNIVRRVWRRIGGHPLVQTLGITVLVILLIFAVGSWLGRNSSKMSPIAGSGSLEVEILG